MIHCDDAELKNVRHDEDVCRGTIKNYVCHIIVLLNKVHSGLRHSLTTYTYTLLITLASSLFIQQLQHL